MLQQLQKKKHQVVDCTCEDCEVDFMEIELELEQKRRLYHKKKNIRKSPQQLIQERYENGDLEIGLLREPSGKFDYYILYQK